jgi:hypothetical protein
MAGGAAGRAKHPFERGEKELKLSDNSPLSPSAMGRLESQLECLQLILQGATPEALDRRPGADKWSARENLAHLARYHQVLLERVELILREVQPALPRYRAEDDPEWPRWQAMSAEEIRLRLGHLRKQLVERIRSLPPEQLTRSGIHSRFGEMSLALWIEFFLVHEGHHLYVILQRVRSA